MANILINALRFILFAFVQVVVLNNLELGWGIYPMLYPLFILLLPFNMGPTTLMIFAFVFGYVIDVFSNTFGLHASSAVFLAYMRPYIFKLFAPRDGYESMDESSIYTMGSRWFFYVYGTMLLIHHAWFFVFELFKWNEWLLFFRKLILSVPASFILSLIVQYIFVSKKKIER